jgi:hypothetical protein
VLPAVVRILKAVGTEVMKGSKPCPMESDPGWKIKPWVGERITLTPPLVLGVNIVS